MKIITRRADGEWAFSNEFSRRMFDLVYSNMQSISPVVGSPSDVYEGWRARWLRRVSREDIRLVLAEQDEALSGFLLYCVDEGSGVVSIDELQVCAERQKDGVTLRRLVLPFISDVSTLQCDFVRTYANKRNPVSPKLALRLGFDRYEETERGWRFRIEKPRLIDRLSHWDFVSGL